jgi:hypothetical protein
LRSDQRLLQEKEEFGFDFRRKISVSQLVVRLVFRSYNSSRLTECSVHLL